MESLWSATAEMPVFPKLERDCRTDVLIIGGGLAGILCAYMLHTAGVDYLLLEADTICSGTTKNTTAKITSQHGLIYQKLIKTFGLERAQMYLQANQQALDEYSRLCQQIPCDFEQKTNYVYAQSDSRKIEKEVEALWQIGFPAVFKEYLPLPFKTAGAVAFADQAQFHPLLFVAGIARNLHIYEHSRVLQLTSGLAQTAKGQVHAEKIIVTTHFPLLNKQGAFFLKLYQHRSYVMAFKQAQQVDGMYVDEAQSGLSFRNYRDLLLLGGGGHRTGKKGGQWMAIESFVRQYYPKAVEAYRWAAQDCMPLDHLPYIGRYTNRSSQLFVATGFQKWGMTASMVAAMLLADLVMGRQNPYQELFAPSRTMLHPQLAAQIAESMISMLTPTVPRCPHMGCALKYNRQEHSWDCPCHGSRFTEEGVLIDNPAAVGLSRK